MQSPDYFGTKLSISDIKKEREKKLVVVKVPSLFRFNQIGQSTKLAKYNENTR
jgi:hypothetical protein